MPFRRAFMRGGTQPTLMRTYRRRARRGCLASLGGPPEWLGHLQFMPTPSVGGGFHQLPPQRQIDPAFKEWTEGSSGKRKRVTPILYSGGAEGKKARHATARGFSEPARGARFWWWWWRRQRLRRQAAGGRRQARRRPPKGVGGDILSLAVNKAC